MKVFAIITACLMATAGAAYYLHSDCPSNESCPLAKSGGCCLATNDAPSCCVDPCPSCSDGCSECCEVCELCCTAGVKEPVSTQISAKSNCCAAGDVCCAAKAACCSDSSTQGNFAISAATAGASLK